LRDWFKNEQERQELARLLELRRRYEQGDINALAEATDNPVIQPKAKPSDERANLPRPEPPHKYEKKNRADYNQWVRDNEDYHQKSPSYFSTDDRKVSFGLQYVAESLRTIWEAYVAQELAQNPLWLPRWVELKEKMLGALGTPEERRQTAYDTIKACRQRPGQSPTDLLNYLRPLWVEIGEVNAYRMVAEFTAALLEDVRRELRYLPQQSRQTLTQVEEAANRIYRDLVTEGKIRKKSDKDKRTPNAPSDTDQGSKRTKRHKKGKGGATQGKNGPDTAKKSKPELECYACGKPGHIAPKCTDTAKKDAYFAKKEKGKGQKN
jgi:ribosomal protein L44E